MGQELPNECYAVIESTAKDEAYHIITNIRNSEHNTFRSDFELQSRFYISSGFEKPYGGQLEATAYSFTLTMLEAAAKVLRKVYKKTETMCKKYGYTESATEIIIRQLQAVGVKEVRIFDHTNGTHPGWNNVEPIPISDLSTIRIKLQKLERTGRETFPFTGKIFN